MGRGRRERWGRVGGGWDNAGREKAGLSWGIKGKTGQCTTGEGWTGATRGRGRQGQGKMVVVGLEEKDMEGLR